MFMVKTGMLQLVLQHCFVRDAVNGERGRYKLKHIVSMLGRMTALTGEFDFSHIL